LKAEHEALRAEHEALKTEHEALKSRLTELEALVRRSSQNSHQPPSADPPGVKRPEKKPSGRRRGGQPGHRGSARELLPADAMNAVVPCKPERCACCGEPLHGEDPQPERHQVTEVVIAPPERTEYQLHELRCGACGHKTRGRLPEGVSYSAFGPRLHALIALLAVSFRLSKRQIQALLADCFAVDVALGSVSNIERTVSRALEKPVEEARELVRRQAVVYLDESSWREGVKRRLVWLWVAVSGVVTVFLIRPSRGAKVAKELVGGGFAGHAVSDRWSAYLWLKSVLRQLCWSHLIRDFRKMKEAGGEAEAVGKDLLACARLLFEQWHRVRDGTLPRSALQEWVSSTLRAQVKALLERGGACGHEKTAGMCRSILEL
jgi:transposase